MHAVLLAILMGATTPAGPPSAKYVQEPNGKTLFDQSCKKCHGVRGAPPQSVKRMMKGIPVLDSAFVSKLSLQKVTTVIEKGKGDMTAFGQKLSAAEVSAVAKYVFELANTKPLATTGK